MQIASVVDMVATHAARVRRHARELNIETQIVVAAGALEAVAAWNSGLDGYAVAGFEVLDFGACPDDFAGALVA